MKCAKKANVMKITTNSIVSSCTVRASLEEKPCASGVICKIFLSIHALGAFLQFKNVQTGKTLVAFAKTVPWEFQTASCQSKLRKNLANRASVRLLK